MTDVAHFLNTDYDPIFQQHQFLPTSTTQPLLNNINPVSLNGFDLTGEQSIEVARPFQSTIFDIQNWSSIIAMTFQQFPQFQFYQLSEDQDLNNQPSSTQQQQQQQQQNTDMTTATYSNQPYTDVGSAQQTTMLQTSLETPPFVEPPITYYPTTTASNSVALNENPPTSTNYPSSRTVFQIGGNYSQQQQRHHHQYLESNYNCPTSNPPRIGLSNPQMINYPSRCLPQRMVYQGSSPSSSIGRNHSKGAIGTNVSSVSYSRPDNVASTLPSSIASNLFTFNTPNNHQSLIVPSTLFDSSIYPTKPTPQTTITIPNSTGSSTPSSESTSPTKQNYSYSGPPKSYYSRLPLYDRPFKCDTCPQSFNRNHDLKRHKRIHLAVKPYPCPYCEKQFSRKDALKRHILVKGCNNTSNNKRPTSPNHNNSGDNNSSNNLGQKSIESECQIKSEPTNDNGANYNI